MIRVARPPRRAAGGVGPPGRAPPPLRPRGGDPRGGRAGDPGRGPLSEGAAARRRLVARGRPEPSDGVYQPGDPRPADRGRVARLAARRQGVVLPPPVLPEQLRSVYAVSLQTMVFAAARARSRPVEDQPERRLAPEGADQAGRSRQLARLVDVQGGEGEAGRQLEHPVRPARPERGERGGGADRPRGLEAGAGTTGRGPSAATGAGPISPT